MASLKSQIKASLAIFGGILVHLTIGTLYCWGNINPYVTSYIRKHSFPSSLQYEDTVWVFALSCTGQGIAMFLGGVLEQRIGTRLATLCGGLIMSVSVLLSAFTIKLSYYWFLVTYGFMFGLGVGIAYTPPLALAMKWLPNNKGVANGLIVAGFGGGAFIFDQVQTAYLNPGNLRALNASMLNTTQDIGVDKYFDQEQILSKVPTMFIILAACYASMQILGVLLMFSVPVKTVAIEEQQKLVTAPSDSEDEVLPSMILRKETDPSIPPREMLRTRGFVTLWLMLFLNAQVVIFISTLYKTYGQNEVFNDDKALSVLGACAAGFNAVGRIVWGAITDRSSFRVAISMVSGAMVILMGSLYATHLVPVSFGEPMFFVWICLIFFTFSGNFCLFPTAVAKVYGPKYISVNYGLLFTSSAVAGPVGALLGTLLFQRLHSYGIFLLSSGMSLIAFILALSFNTRTYDGKPV